MNKEALADLFYKEILKIDRSDTLDPVHRIDALYRLLNLLFVEITRREQIQFATMFARIAYACHQHQVEKQIQFYIHHFRKQALRTLRKREADPSDYALGLKVLIETQVALFGKIPPSEVANKVSPKWPYPYTPATIREFKRQARVVALSDDEDKEQFIIRDQERPEEVVRMKYNIPERNSSFMPTIHTIRKVTRFPVMLNLIDVEVDQSGNYRPRAIVLEPDYLVDVSAVAECFKGKANVPFLYLLKKYLPFETSKYLILGNIANFFLDELMSRPDATFKELFPKVFKLNPLAFCLFEDRLIREIMQKAQLHYTKLKRVILQEFHKVGIDPKDCFLEPSFYSEKYGLQGRLDVFYRGEEKSAIVELKSGKAYMPNIHGISPNHFIQTLLYDLLIKSTFGSAMDPVNFILYSGVEDRNLRFAPSIKAQQMEAIQVRNQLFAIEKLLSELGVGEEDLLDQGRKIFNRLSPNNYPELKGFVQRDLGVFRDLYQKLNPLTKKYFIAFSGFIAREHLLAKVGMEGVESLNGVAALWLNDLRQKQDDFEVINHLLMQDNKAKEEEPLIVFRKSEQTNQLANFRKGDIAVLYPLEEDETGILTNQIFKCTILDISNEQVTIRLRSRQFNDALFRQVEFWNLEHDMLDSGFNAMYRGLFAFAESPPEKRELLLGNRMPKEAPISELEVSAELTDEQKDIFRKVVAAEEYFLLWGPPGTGKTSMMLKHLVGYLLEHTSENILLLAYTNRAVDEICDAIERLGPAVKENYLRIGSRYSTAARFQDRLLRSRIEKVTSRKELKQIILQHRIVVATVASMSSRPELMKLKSFDRVIIDEASQILEPVLVGMLPSFNRFILIGDHKQLPAVVTQDENASQILDEDLKNIGLNNLRNSLFERLYKKCKQEQWHHAYAQLSHQGRMHKQIMHFPNQYFYEGTLKVLPENIEHSTIQLAAMSYQVNGIANDLEKLICTERVLFLPTPPDESSGMKKVNRHEAMLIGDLVEAFRKIYKSNDRVLSKDSIGIITPYRAQIAQIRSELENREISSGDLTIDTVERYQGGARDIILISLCTNSLSQLTSLVSLSEEGVDRKLNVALTRAKEHIVIIGNPQLLRSNSIYKQLIRFCQEV